MIVGAHCVMYSRESDLEGVRAWLRDVAGLPVEDSMPDWPIYSLGPAELSTHPVGDAEPLANERRGVELYLVCDDIEATVAELQGRGGELSQPPEDQGWGIVAAFRLPDGSDLHVYEPRHKTTFGS